jgi:hypothetical protein
MKDKMVIRLRVLGEGDRSALLVVKMKTGAVVTVIEHSGADAAGALEHAGVDSYIMIGAFVHVSRDEIEWHLRNWGPMSRPRILLRGEELCRPEGSLAELASQSMFRLALEEDRELLAALWVMWKQDGKGREAHEPGVVTVQIDRYLLCEKDGTVTVQEYRSVAVASDRLSDSHAAYLRSQASASSRRP